jgi:hypothetical protein
MIRSLEGFSDDELVMLFAENCTEEEALANSGAGKDVSKFEKEVSALSELIFLKLNIANELRKRGRASLLALAKLYDHPNGYVRYQAALLTSEEAPSEAKRIIDSIAQSRMDD